MTLREVLAAALIKQDAVFYQQPSDKELSEMADAILAAIPADVAVVTVDTLKAAMLASWQEWLNDPTAEPDPMGSLAVAVFAAIKDATDAGS